MGKGRDSGGGGNETGNAPRHRPVMVEVVEDGEGQTPVKNGAVSVVGDGTSNNGGGGGDGGGDEDGTADFRGKKTCNGGEEVVATGQRINGGVLVASRRERAENGGGGHTDRGGETQKVGRDGCENHAQEIEDEKEGWGGEDEEDGLGMAGNSVVSLGCRCPCSCGRGGDGPSAAGESGRYGSRSVRVVGVSADLSRVEQLVGGAAMLRGCALGVEFVARVAERSPELTVSETLDALDVALRREGGGGVEALTQAFVEEEGGAEMEGVGGQGKGEGTAVTTAAAGTVNDDGVVALSSIRYGPLIARPRRFEVAAALHRLPGVKFRRAASVVTRGGAAEGE